MSATQFEQELHRCSMTSTQDQSVLAGSCFCGAARYRVRDAFEYALNCHCSQCQRTTGSAFKAFAGAKVEALVSPPQERVRLTYGDEAAHDVHCRVCGSLLYSVVREHAWVHIAMGTLLDTPSIRPQAHIFVQSKAPWFTITDDLPQFAEHVS